MKGSESHHQQTELDKPDTKPDPRHRTLLYLPRSRTEETNLNLKGDTWKTYFQVSNTQECRITAQEPG